MTTESWTARAWGCEQRAPDREDRGAGVLPPAASRHEQHTRQRSALRWDDLAAPLAFGLFTWAAVSSEDRRSVEATNDDLI